jgi:hypothetical protein
MRTTSEEEMIARGGRVGQVGSFIAVIMAVGAVFASFTPWKSIAIVLVAVAVVLYTVGNRQIGQAAREPRLIEQLANALKGFDDRYHLYNHILPADHILLTPSGMFVIVVRGMGGKIRLFKGKWLREITVGRILRFFTEESLGNPTKDAQREVKKLHEYIEERYPEAAVEIQGLVVFVSPEVRLEVTGASIPVLPLRALRAHIRKASPERELPRQTLAALTKIFDEAPRL